MKFRAEEIHCKYDGNDVLVIGFTSGFNEREDKRYFMIQDALEYDRQDMQLGTDTYFIEKNNQASGMYGGISNMVLTRDSVLFELEESAQQKLDEESIEIELNCSEEVYRELSAKLHLIFMRDEPDFV